MCSLNPSWPYDSVGNGESGEKAGMRWREIVPVVRNGCGSAGHFEGPLISGAQTRSRLTAAPWDKRSLSHGRHQETLLPTDNLPTSLSGSRAPEALQMTARSQIL